MTTDPGEVDERRSAWALHGAVSAALLLAVGVTFAVLAAYAVQAGAPDPVSATSPFAALGEAWKAAGGWLLLLFGLALLLGAATTAAVGVGVEIVLATALLLVLRPFGPVKVLVAHAAATVLAVVGWAAVGVVAERLEARPSGPPPLGIEVDRLVAFGSPPRLLVADVVAEEAGTVGVHVHGRDGDTSWSADLEGVVVGAGRTRVALLPADDGVAWQTFALSAELQGATRWGRDDRDERALAVERRPSPPTVLARVEADGAAEGRVRAALVDLPLAGCAELGPLEVVVITSREGAVRADVTATGAPAAARCVERLVGSARLGGVAFVGEVDLAAP